MSVRSSSTCDAGRDPVAVASSNVRPLSPRRPAGQFTLPFPLPASHHQPSKSVAHVGFFVL
ncbi:hypothetical protein HYPSUDRAFT_35972 [Hypholoma sublateritium FD-334 SS-4]|uniref:Uncharacterized protein n=1 Tax=Hypholoma sublateritium (strain FD-334 SS-4) TaxID=945553 RepID=A0A0D2PE21_HYPSF|nr:hypothetical protein HYPSUDRAFT_35972 [Hypholoma sublateritium FD-334 SS-4]